MKYRVWRSLDRPSSFFGVRGKFAYIFAALAAAGAMLSFVIGGATSSLVGMIAFACSCVGAYMLVISIQGKMSERSLARFLASRRTPRFLKMSPKSIRSTLKHY